MTIFNDYHLITILELNYNFMLSNIIRLLRLEVKK